MAEWNSDIYPFSSQGTFLLRIRRAGRPGENLGVIFSNFLTDEVIPAHFKAYGSEKQTEYGGVCYL